MSDPQLEAYCKDVRYHGGWTPEHRSLRA